MGGFATGGALPKEVVNKESTLPGAFQLRLMRSGIYRLCLYVGPLRVEIPSFPPPEKSIANIFRQSTNMLTPGFTDQPAPRVSSIFNGLNMTHLDLEKYKAMLGKTDFSDQEANEMLTLYFTFMRTLIQENFDSQPDFKTPQNDAIFRSENPAFYGTVKTVSDYIEAKENKGFPEFKGIEP